MGHSFSAKYFLGKFAREGIEAEYKLYPLENITDVTPLLQDQDFVGLNVTLPYKTTIIPYLDALDATAQAIGAVNVIAREDGRWIGYNTDCIGFEDSLCDVLDNAIMRRALILGTGGASKAVAYVLQKHGIDYQFVSRRVGQELHYDALTIEKIREIKLIVNCTPLGMYPDVNSCPPIPYEGLTSEHLLYDLVYNPEQTLFLRKGAAMGTRTRNGLMMLYKQADAAWQLWNKIK